MVKSRSCVGMVGVNFPHLSWCCKTTKPTQFEAQLKLENQLRMCIHMFRIAEILKSVSKLWNQTIPFVEMKRPNVMKVMDKEKTICCSSSLMNTCSMMLSPCLLYWNPCSSVALNVSSQRVYTQWPLLKQHSCTGLKKSAISKELKGNLYGFFSVLFSVRSSSLCLVSLATFGM